MNLLYDFGDGRLVRAAPHPNGGGMVAATAQVAPTVYVGPRCRVAGHAVIRGRAKITDSAFIDGAPHPAGCSVLIEDNAQVSGNAHITGKVLIRDSAKVLKNARLTGSVHVLHNSIVSDNAQVSGNWILLGESVVDGNSKLSGTREVKVRDRLIRNEVLEYNVRTSDRKARASAARPKLIEPVPDHRDRLAA